MSQRSYPYAVSRIKVLEETLIDQNTWSRLWESSLEDCYRLLHEIGYGKSAQDQNDIDDLTQASVTEARELINEVTPDEAITNLFLLQVDGHNIKAILKGLIQRENVDSILLPGGTVPLPVLKEAFDLDTFEALPTKLREAVEAFDPDTPPNILSAQIDDAVYDQILMVLSNKKTQNALAERYFRSRIDFTNVLTILRSHHLGWGPDQARPMIVPGGDLASAMLLSALEQDPSHMPEILGQGSYAEEIREAVADYLQNGNIYKTESRFYRTSYEIVHAEFMDSFGIGPILNYLLQKEFEARTLRILFAAKRSGRSIPLTDLGVR